MKTVKLSLETARQMYKSSEPSVKQFALDNYTKEELEAKELPSRWEDLKNINGYYVHADGYVTKAVAVSCEDYQENECNVSNGVWPTKELAEASVALAKLIYLRDVYNDGCQFKDLGHSIYKSYNQNDVFTSGSSNHCNFTILRFKNNMLRELFFNNFRDLIETAKPLL